MIECLYSTKIRKVLGNPSQAAERFPETQVREILRAELEHRYTQCWCTRLTTSKLCEIIAFICIDAMVDGCDPVWKFGKKQKLTCWRYLCYNTGTSRSPQFKCPSRLREAGPVLEVPALWRQENNPNYWDSRMLMSISSCHRERMGRSTAIVHKWLS